MSKINSDPQEEVLIPFPSWITWKWVRTISWPADGKLKFSLANRFDLVLKTAISNWHKTAKFLATKFLRLICRKKSFLSHRVTEQYFYYKQFFHWVLTNSVALRGLAFSLEILQKQLRQELSYMKWNDDCHLFLVKHYLKLLQNSQFEWSNW